MKYVALFRGINVGGKNIVKMADLKKLFVDSGFENVRAYIQSGNIVFDSEEEPDAVTGKIRTGFKATFGFESAVTLRTEDEMAAIIRDLPFSPEETATAEAAHPDSEILSMDYMQFASRDEFKNSIVHFGKALKARNIPPKTAASIMATQCKPIAGRTLVAFANGFVLVTEIASRP